MNNQFEQAMLVTTVLFTIIVWVWLLVRELRKGTRANDQTVMTLMLIGHLIIWMLSVLVMTALYWFVRLVVAFYERWADYLSWL